MLKILRAILMEAAAGGGGGSPSPTPTPSPTPAPTPTPAPSPAPTPSPTPAPTPAPTPTATVFGDKWREELAGDDKEYLAQLQRFASPKEYSKSYQAAQQRIRSGDVKKPLPANANAQELSAWRKENGIPENAGEYLTNMPNGLVIGEADKPMFTELANFLHGKNLPPAVAHTMVEFYNATLQKSEAAADQADADAARKFDETLRAEWGKDYTVNMNLANHVLEHHFGKAGKLLSEAYLPGGMQVKSSPEVMRVLAQLGRELNPAQTLVPTEGGGDGGLKSVEGEIAKLKELMAKPSSEYHKGPNAEANQKRYRDLITAREKLKARAA